MIVWPNFSAPGIQRVGDGDVDEIDFLGRHLPSLVLQRYLTRPSESRRYYRQIRVKNAVIGQSGENLNLSYATLNVPIVFENCAIPGPVVLKGSKTKSLSFKKCRMYGIDLSGAQIRGDLSFNGSCFPLYRQPGDDLHHWSIDARGCNIAGKVSFNRCIALSGVCMSRSRIGGSLNCSGAIFMSAEYASRTWSPHENKQLCDGLTNHQQNCPNCLCGILKKLHPNSHTTTGEDGFLIIDRYRSVVDLIHEITSKYIGHAIYAPFTKTSAHLYETGCPGYKSLDLYNVAVGGNVYYKHGFAGIGEVSMNSASVQGAIYCNNFLFFQEGGVALSLEGTKVKSSVFILGTKEYQSSVRGTLSCRGASIGHRLVCDGVAFYKPLLEVSKEYEEDFFRRREGYAFFGKGLTVAGDVSFGKSQSRSYETNGNVQENSTPAPPIGRFCLENACIGGSLELSCTVLDDFMEASEEDLLYLNLEFAEVSGVCQIGIKISQFESNRSKSVSASLKDAIVGRLDINGSENVRGPTKKCVKWTLEGLRYKSVELNKSTRESPERLWTKYILKSNSNWNNTAIQPYDQLIKALKESGEEQVAKKVAIARENRVTANLARSIIKLHNFWVVPFLVVDLVWRFIAIVAGYGYRPAAVFIGLVMLIGIGTWIFDSHQSDFFAARAAYYTAQFSFKNAIAWEHNSDKPKCEGTECKPEGYPDFIPFLYSLELATPVPHLGMEEHWDIRDGAATWVEIYKYVHCILGWILCVMLVLSPIAMLRKD